MRSTGLPPWERLLLVAALVLGVLAMHATPFFCPSEPAGSHLLMTAMSDDADGAGPAGGHDRGADPGTHHVLAPCLAILAVALLLVTLRLLLGVPVATATGPRGMRALAATAARSPPGATTVRLAQLCVSRR